MSPTRPKTAVSIDLLEVYRALFERSCDAINALSAALHTIYKRRGFQVVSPQKHGMPVKDPFRPGLQQAVQWYSNLRTALQTKMEEVLAAADCPAPPSAPIRAPSTTSADASATTVEHVADSPGPASHVLVAADSPALISAPFQAPSATSADTSATAMEDVEQPTRVSTPSPVAAPASPHSPPDSYTSASTADASATTADGSSEATSTSAPSPQPPRLTPGRADRVLRERCPACFGLEEWGRPLEEGGDVQVGGDGCFSYRHVRRAGDGPISYNPTYFISKDKVDAAGDRINRARKNKPSSLEPLIPQEVLDACNATFDAANEKKRNADPKFYDASGVFVMVCRHGQVLFLCNIDTPGEQQKYVLAGLEELISLLPPEATALKTYDIGCQTNRSLDLYPLLTEGVRERVAFVLNAMHSYRHEWACQLVYSPRLRRGMALTDGEAVERFWSRIRKLIAITRHQWNSRRIWTIDQYTVFVNEDGLNRLGDWIARQRETNLPKKYKAAMKTIRECRVPVPELRSQWAAQKAAETSIRASAPMRLKQELSKVLGLQTQIDAVEQSIEDTKKSVTGPNATPESLDLLRGLEATHETLSSQAQMLYGSLNIHEGIPELRGLPLAFVTLLMTMRNLKMEIRRRAINSFKELATLRRAVAGQREANGTKLNTATRRAIEKRKPALLRLISKYNTYCAEIAEDWPPRCHIPMPSPLPTETTALRNDPSLYQDLWVYPTPGGVPRWMDDADVRDGIRSVHIVDRCVEETVRLKLECASMSRWLQNELEIVARAIQTLTDPILELALQQRQQSLRALRFSWETILDGNEHSVVAPLSGSIPLSSPRLLADTSAPLADASATTHHIEQRIVTLTLEAQEDFLDNDDFIEPFDMPVTSQELDPGTISNLDERILVEEMIANTDEDEDEDEEDTCHIQFERDQLQLEINWEPPASVQGDSSFLQILQERIRSLPVLSNDLPRSVVGVAGRPTLKLKWKICIASTRQLVASMALGSTGWLPHCMLLSQIGALFSAHMISSVSIAGVATTNSGASHPRPHSGTSLFGYCPYIDLRKSIGVVAAVHIRQQKIFFFDSLAQTSRLAGDIMVLINRLTLLANRHNHPLQISTQQDAWVAQPLFQLGEPSQTNGYDCGLWVLCTIAAVLRGFDCSTLSEGQMRLVRTTFVNHILTLPFT
ncbi:hypothetical protein B0H14DRAFT_3774904 [Mycena olivaceomarginata]|nr:hypothetical protein B0H14DRAFT_3774904 [Mycena olivaceomarginata]